MKSILFILLAILLVANVFAQDIIITTKGEELTVKVLEVGKSYIKYKKSDTSITDLFAIEKSSVFMIKYQNGTKDIFTTPENSHTSDNAENAEGPGLKEMPGDMAERGKKDAKEYYHGYKGCSGGTVAATIFGDGVGGLILACACASTPPMERNLNYPDDQLMKNPDYKMAYKTEAYRIKKRKTWGAFGTTAGIELVIIIAITVLLNGGY